MKSASTRERLRLEVAGRRIQDDNSDVSSTTSFGSAEDWPYEPDEIRRAQGVRR